MEVIEIIIGSIPELMIGICLGFLIWQFVKLLRSIGAYYDSKARVNLHKVEPMMTDDPNERA